MDGDQKLQAIVSLLVFMAVALVIGLGFRYGATQTAAKLACVEAGHEPAACSEMLK